MDRCYDIKARLVDRLDLPFLTWVHTLKAPPEHSSTGIPTAANS